MSEITGQPVVVLIELASLAAAHLNSRSAKNEQEKSVK